MRLKKYEIVLICAAVLLAVFTAGFVVGRYTARTTVTVSGTASSNNSDFGYASGKININSAGSNELAELPGIGSRLADAIVNYREIHGDFSAISDIILVDGIGAALYETIRPYITV